MNVVGYWEIGTEQWAAKDGWQRALFYRLFGALDMHTRIRVASTLQVIERCPLPSGARVLDAGCGEGTALFWLARRFPSHRLMGIDVSEEKIRLARYIADRANLDNVDFECADLQDLDSESEFDLAFSIDALEHIPDDRRVLRNLWRALEARGELIVHIPRNRNQQTRVFRPYARHQVDDHVRPEYAETEIREKVLEAGFRIASLDYTFGLWGELSWEVNNLFWLDPTLMRLISLATFPLCFALGYWDVARCSRDGNSFLLTAVKDAV